MPVVAIVGRPNVGKSTLFNHLVGQKRAIVGPERGITRDRIYGRLSLDGGLEADLVDTGGFDTTGEGDFSRHMFDQTMMAIRESDLVVCLFDALSELTADDRELVRILRESAIPVIYVANKVDDPNRSAASAMLYELGLQDFVEISARKKTGLKELKERIRLAVQDMPGTDLEHETDAVRVSILGRPNVGKSLLLNRIIGEERAIVSPVAGTTRDYIDIRVSHGGKDYVFVDTAGIRRKSRIQDMLERESVLRSLKNVNLSHVCLLLIDPAEGVTEQDKRISSIMAEHGRAFVVVVNKSDLLEPGSRIKVREAVHYSLKYIPDVRVVFVSALTGKNVGKIYPLIDELFTKTTIQVATGRLNRVLEDVTESCTPPVVKGRQVKFFYANQVGTAPPEFRIVTNFPDSIQPGYHRYLIHSFKKALSLQGVPIKLRFVPRS
ncbi:MAG TPA: ribosome biogenesis GTPase Der [Deltaproteobacteria bacterium]|nr:ribosome biogenesis GTPase Der [Deltaproteobacteria bacterium]